MKVLNFGSLNLDFVYNVDHFVKPGETLNALSTAVNPGGKGLNQSIALARAGVEVYHAGSIGKGGETLRELLDENGVDTSLVNMSHELQGNAMIQVNTEGENCIILFGGSNQSVTSEQIKITLDSFGEGDFLVLQNEINSIPLIVDMAYEKGMRIVLNPSPFNEKLDDVDFNKLSWLFINEVEAEQISGARSPKKAFEYLHDRYPYLSVLITLGSEGSMAWRVEDGEIKKCSQEIFPVKAVDTTAAGDTYTGFFVAGLIDNRSLKESMEIAGMASAISVTRPGAASSIPTKEEVLNELRRIH